MNKIATCLWFDTQGEEAAKFYVETFRACGQEASLGDYLYYDDNNPKRRGSVLTVNFTLAGSDYIALNGGPEFKFTPAVSMMVKCKDQAEIDRFWDRLVEGGAPIECSWLTDRFGLAWQIAPAEIFDMLRDPDKARASRVMQAMMKMVKIDIATLRKAYEG